MSAIIISQSTIMIQSISFKPQQVKHINQPNLLINLLFQARSLRMQSNPLSQARFLELK